MQLQFTLTPSKAATLSSVDGHSAFLVCESYYVVPTLPVPSDQLEKWRLEIEPRLQSELPHVLKKVRCQLEFLIFTTIQGQSEAGILLTCWSERVPSLTNDKRQKWRRALQRKVDKTESLKASPFRCLVAIDSTRHLGHQPILARSTSMLQIKHPHMRTTVCGALIQRAPGRSAATVHCTLGGVIMIKSEWYGMTVLHPFESFRDDLDARRLSNSCSSLLSTLSSESESSKFGLSTESLYNTNKTDGLPDLPEPTVDSAYGSRAIDETSEIADETPDLCDTHQTLGSLATDLNLRASDRLDQLGSKTDFAFIRLSDGFEVLPNRYQPKEGAPWETINVVASTSPHDIPLALGVFVLAGVTGVTSGRIGQKDVTLRFESQTYFVTQVILDKPLGEPFPCCMFSRADLYV